MLRRFLGLAGADFWYANSCNRQSGPLWAKCGAAMVPESDVEYLLPIRLGPLAQELAARKGWPRAVGSMLRRLWDPRLRRCSTRQRPNRRFNVEYCVDLEQLADLAERNRDPALSPTGQVRRVSRVGLWLASAGPQQRPAAAGFHVSRDKNGAVGVVRHPFRPPGPIRANPDSAPGRRGLARRHRMSSTDILPAILEVVRARCDLLSIRGRVGLELYERSIKLKRRTLLAPEGYLVSRDAALGRAGRAGGSSVRRPVLAAGRFRAQGPSTFKP